MLVGTKQFFPELFTGELCPREGQCFTEGGHYSLVNFVLGGGDNFPWGETVFTSEFCPRGTKFTNELCSGGQKSLLKNIRGGHSVGEQSTLWHRVRMPTQGHAFNCMLSGIVRVYQCTSTDELVRLCSFGSLVLWISFRSPSNLLYRSNCHVEK